MSRQSSARPSLTSSLKHFATLETRKQAHFGAPGALDGAPADAQAYAMPIRRELRPLYPRHWTELSRQVRFERAGGECERCRRPHGLVLRCLPDGRWFDPRLGTWRDRRGRPARWPDLEDLTKQRTTRVILAAAHLNHNPARSGRRNLRSFCQRCHLAHDRAWHLLQRWITYRLRYACADLFLGPYRHGPSAAVLLAEVLGQISDRLSQARDAEPRRQPSSGALAQVLPLF
jgi:hypothetical protein